MFNVRVIKRFPKIPYDEKKLKANPGTRTGMQLPLHKK